MRDVDLHRLWSNKKAPLDPAEQPLCRRNTEDKSGIGLNSEWAFSWPSNRRILYNRNSCDMQGKPWNEDKKLMEWNGEKWILVDQADFVAVKGDEPVPPNNKTFFMLWEQNARLESYGMVDGPLPEHYEPFESPADNQMNGAFHNSPCIRHASTSTKKGDRSQYPIVDHRTRSPSIGRPAARPVCARRSWSPCRPSSSR